jgi:hypothetical protein
LSSGSRSWGGRQRRRLICGGFRWSFGWSLRRFSALSFSHARRRLDRLHGRLDRLHGQLFRRKASMHLVMRRSSIGRQMARSSDGGSCRVCQRQSEERDNNDGGLHVVRSLPRSKIVRRKLPQTMDRCVTGHSSQSSNSSER